ncbi:unnamed protein product [Durusdinium trenchii]|uniref:Uncharacterized protein n=1 Tax=Durusdinium trenchii TaxID=1381693 RepID=A0ABP0N3B9_9DINO
MLFFQKKNAVLILLLLLFSSASASFPEDEEQHVVGDFLEPPEVDVQETMKQSENICISMMLLGCMGFMMANFYLVNWPDEDIRRISWEVISSTVSIFSAVLLFQACNKALEYYILEGLWIWYQLAVDMVHMLLWFTALQLVLAYLSGAMGAHEEVSSRRWSLRKSLSLTWMSPSTRLKRAQSAEMHFKAVKINTVCWATLLGHVTGFAAINAWGTLQQAVPRNLLCCGLIPLVTFAGIWSIYQATEKLRKIQIEQDEEEDEFEELWGEEVAETENDVMSLAVSFLLVQALRFCISGYLPNAEGNDPKGLKQSNLACELLLFAAFVFGGFDIVQISLRKLLKLGNEGSDVEEQRVSYNELDQAHRYHTWCRDILAMATAWSIHFSVDWWLSANIMADGAVLAVICAVVVTCFALLLIFVLDKLADMEFTDNEVDSSLRALISSLGILIGFSWERSFDEAVGGLAEGRVFGLPPPVLTLILAIFLASMVVPAWKWYILPVVESHKEESRVHHVHPHEATISENHLEKPLLKDFAQDGAHAQSETRQTQPQPGIMDDTALKQQLEAARHSIAELEEQLAGKDGALTEAKQRTTELELALQSVGVREDPSEQHHKEMHEKDNQLQDSARGSLAESEQLRREQGLQAEALQNAKAEAADLHHKVQMLQEELVKADAAKQAFSSQWEEKLHDEVGRRVMVEERLRERSSQLSELQAEKNAELDRMAAVATDTECRLRQAQATLAEQEQATSRAANDTLKDELARTADKANALANQLASVEKENQVLLAEVNRLRGENKPSFVPRAVRGTSTPQPGAAGARSMPSPQDTSSPPQSSQASLPGQTFQPAAFASPSLRAAPSGAGLSMKPVQTTSRSAVPGVVSERPDRKTVQNPRSPPSPAQPKRTAIPKQTPGARVLGDRPRPVRPSVPARVPGDSPKRGLPQ